MDLFPPFSDAIRSAAAGRVTPAASFLDMVDGDVRMEFPFAAPDGVTQVTGRDALRVYLEDVAALVTMEQVVVERVHHAADAAIIEFGASGRGRASGIPYEQRYIAVIEVRNGLITTYRDYWNPMVFAALGSAGGGRMKGGVLVTGGTGEVGSRTASALQDAGAEVSIATRHPTKALRSLSTGRTTRRSPRLREPTRCSSWLLPEPGIRWRPWHPA